MRIKFTLYFLLFFLGSYTYGQDGESISLGEKIFSELQLPQANVDSILSILQAHGERMKELNAIEVRDPKKRAELIQKFNKQKRKQLQKHVGHIKNISKLNNIVKQHARENSLKRSAHNINLKNKVNEYLAINAVDIIFDARTEFNKQISPEDKVYIDSLIIEARNYNDDLWERNKTCTALKGAAKINCNRILKLYKEKTPDYIVKAYSILHRLENEVNSSLQPLEKYRKKWEKDIGNIYSDFYPKAEENLKNTFVANALLIIEPKRFLLLNLDNKESFKLSQQAADTLTLIPSKDFYGLLLNLNLRNPVKITAYFQNEKPLKIVDTNLNAGEIFIPLDEDIFSSQYCIFEFKTGLKTNYKKIFIP